MPAGNQAKVFANRSLTSIAAIAVGLVSLAMISTTLFVPWYEVDEYYWKGNLEHHDEYGLLDFTRDGQYMSYKDGTIFRARLLFYDMTDAGDFMHKILLIVAFSLVMSLAALVLTILKMKRIGVIAGATAAAAILLSGCHFYVGIADVLGLDGFLGITQLSRSYWADAGPMLGYLITTVAPIAQSTQAILLAYSGED
jgi:hypothetical protein